MPAETGHPIEVDGTVWAASGVPAPPPVEGFAGDRYCVAWVDVAGGERLQALVDVPDPPAPGTAGTLTLHGAAGVPTFAPTP